MSENKHSKNISNFSEKSNYGRSNLDTTINLGKITLQNPVVTASGTFGYGEEIRKYMDPDILGAITVKGLTVKPTSGNATPRIAETSSGILNSIGLENPGINNFLKERSN